MSIIEINNETAYEHKYHPNYFITKSGKIYSTYVKGAHGKTNVNNPWPLAYGQDRDGYYRVVLSLNGKLTRIKVHKLVCEQFIGDIPEGMVVNHIDGNKHNNNTDNLEIVTPLENTRHAWNTGLNRKELNPNRIDVNVKEISTNKTYHYGSLKEACDAINVSIRYIRYLKDSNEIKYRYCYLEKIKTGTKNTDYYLNCYFNGQLVKTFASNEECGNYFGKSKNAISAFVTSGKTNNKKYNQYTITFPNVSTIENTIN